MCRVDLAILSDAALTSLPDRPVSQPGAPSLDLRRLVRLELASRGANERGEFVGFNKADALLVEPSAVDEAIVSRIAQRSLDLPTLETRNRDSLDFKEQSVWGIRNALLCALRADQEVA